MSSELIKLTKELEDRFVYFYGQVDGSFKFPNSCEGDLLKMTKKLLDQLKMSNIKIITLDDIPIPYTGE